MNVDFIYIYIYILYIYVYICIYIYSKFEDCKLDWRQILSLNMDILV